MVRIVMMGLVCSLRYDGRKMARELNRQLLNTKLGVEPLTFHELSDLTDAV